MDIGRTLDVTQREEWRRWLTQNHASEAEIWLVYFTQASERRFSCEAQRSILSD